MKKELKKITTQTIKTVVAINLYNKVELNESDAAWIENDVTKLIGERDSDYRFEVEEMVKEYLRKIANPETSNPLADVHYRL